jgi:hypothetical protein
MIFGVLIIFVSFFFQTCLIMVVQPVRLKKTCFRSKKC